MSARTAIPLLLFGVYKYKYVLAYNIEPKQSCIIAAESDVYVIYFLCETINHFGSKRWDTKSTCTNYSTVVVPTHLPELQNKSYVSVIDYVLRQ